MEDFLHDAIDWVVPWVEAAGAAMILAGVVVAIARVVWVPFMRVRPPLAALQIRTGLALTLALGLEFLLAGDILRTAVSPTYRQVALLAAIATIRTGLNFFLGRELLEGRHQLETLAGSELDHRVIGTPSLRRGGRSRSETGASPPSRDDAFRASLRAALLGPLASSGPLRDRGGSPRLHRKPGVPTT